ncbi:integrase core domain-containing protein [Rhodocytophaga aerolata]|uniref:integrase core domain-containing protein n=1 Tax=Rhodocytophaga aerolata TaxID=455078 RepID=UPI00265C9554|nr:integrase core domain-containing protein [Rhodocytophaga aerolata]
MKNSCFVTLVIDSTLEPSNHGINCSLQYCIYVHINWADDDIVCWSVSEQVNGTIKNEFYCRGFLTFPLAHERIARAIHSYNYLRPHAGCDYLMPAQAHFIEG